MTFITMITSISIITIIGLYRDNGKESGNYYLGFRVWGFASLS